MMLKRRVIGSVVVSLVIIAGIFGCRNHEPVIDKKDQYVTERKAPVRTVPSAAGIQNFGDPNFDKLIQKIHALRAVLGTAGEGAADKLHIIQLGDSHTASDTFTGPLRRMLQHELGDAGIGWISPMNVRGQSHQRVKITSRHWQLTSSRNEISDHFPLGGLIATPTRRGAWIKIDTHEPDDGRYRVVFRMRQLSNAATLTLEDADGQRRTLRIAQQANTGWQSVTASVRLPFKLTAGADRAVELGGIWLERQEGGGVTVSPIGSNGARQVIWQRWGNDWLAQLAQTQAGLVILAYGTNEAFDENLDLELMRNELAQGIRQIRQYLPDAVILLIGAPDVLLSSSDPELACDARRPVIWHAVKKVQEDVAVQEKTLYWDWYAAMDGSCPMLDWQQRELVGKDLVHFTMSGYRESARDFYNDFIAMLGFLK